MVSVERVRLAYNNVYLVSEGERLVAIDTGPDYRGAQETITAALRGRRPELVVATHGHLDHAGLGAWWQAQGVPVLLGAADVPQAAGAVDTDIDLMEDYIRGIGAPADVEAEVVAGLEMRRGWTRRMRHATDWPEARDGRWPTGLRYAPFEPREKTSGGHMLAIGGIAVLHSPGHTPGNLVAEARDAEGLLVLFSGDQLLPEITPTPAIQFESRQRFPSLPRFLDSLRVLADREHAPAICYPGHGEPFENVAQVIAANLSQADQRTERLAEELRAGGPATVYAVAERMYPRALRRRFWQIISTVQGHLDVLGEAGRATLEDGRWR
jgi:glyoxylase-like metal-dependent hydrolase (beta-lactamase superfamily II)